jgi:tungstate transport system substrate-binding protein
MKKNIIFKAVFLFAVSMILISSVYASPIHLKLATTTSTDNSGLLGVLLPSFEEKFKIKVDVFMPEQQRMNLLKKVME